MTTTSNPDHFVLRHSFKCRLTYYNLWVIQVNACKYLSPSFFAKAKMQLFKMKNFSRPQNWDITDVKKISISASLHNISLGSHFAVG